MASSSSWTYLSSLQAIRDRATKVYQAAQQQELSNFDFHPELLDSAADVVVQTILGSFSPDQFASIPPHGRWQHFDVGPTERVSKLLQKWREAGTDDTECCRRLIDLFFVSVLLDAGAGDSWGYTELSTGLRFERSEGIAVASLYCFLDGAFGTADSVNGRALCDLQAKTLIDGMQASEQNPMTGVEGRLELLQRLGASLLAQETIFGKEGRPGNLVDYLRSTTDASGTLNVEVLWFCLQQVLLPIWPSDRLTVDGRAVGDAWPLSTLSSSPSHSSEPYNNIQPFHKLTQWLAYSLMVPFERILNHKWTNSHLLTGLPEYRNGGLFVDTGVLSLKPEILARGQENNTSQPGSGLPEFEPSDDVIVEWRAMTVVLLDDMLALVNDRLSKMALDNANSGASGSKAETDTGKPAVKLSLAQMLEAGTWKAGRILAAKYRPTTKSSPILIRSDGTLF